MKTFVIATLTAIVACSAAAFVPIHHPMHPIHRIHHHHSRPPAKSVSRPMYREPRHIPSPHYRYPSTLPLWLYAAIISHKKPVVGPVKQVEVWIDGHYETQLQPNGQTALIWIPGHFELLPTY